MTKRGQIVCTECNWTTDGELPDDNPEGFHYVLMREEITSKDAFANNVVLHHLSTPREDGFWGHKKYTVFLEDGGTGEIEGNSYCVIYTEHEHGNKERE